MGNIGDYLKKFSHFISDKKEEKRGIIELFQDYSLVVSEDQCEIKEGVLFLSVKPILKTEIFMQKNIILSRLKERGVKITDIRFR